jgi:phage shock protein A
MALTAAETGDLRSIATRVKGLENFMKEHTEQEVGHAASLKALETAHLALVSEVAENTKTTNAIKADTAMLREFVQTYRAMSMLGRVATRVLMWLSLVGGGMAAMWVALKTGRLP